MVPCVGTEQVGADAFRVTQCPPVEPFLDQDRQECRCQGQHVRAQKLRRGEQPVAGIPADTQSYREQRKAEDQGRNRLVAGVAVGMITVGPLHRVDPRPQDKRIGEEVGERVNAVRDQGLGVAEQTPSDLEHAQDQSDRGTDKGGSGYGVGTRLGRGRKRRG